ncbi:unnamed protein product [Boreogadus saida]
MYQEVAFLAGSTEHQFTSFHFNPPENPQEVSSKKGLYYKRAQLLLLQPQQRHAAPRDDHPPGDDSASPSAIINVGGIKYRIPWSTLDEFPLTRLGRLRGCSSEAEIMAVCDDYDGRRNEYFFDRSPSAFRTIVTFLAAGKLRLLREMCALSFQEELLYWGVEEQSLDWCCLRKLRLRQEEYKEQRRLEEEEEEAAAELTAASPSGEEERAPPGATPGAGAGAGSAVVVVVVGPTGAGGVQDEEGQGGDCMRRLRDMVENPHSGVPGKVFACLSVVFVAITAITLCISTMPDLREEEERILMSQSLGMTGWDPIPLCSWRAWTLYPSVHDGLGPYTPLFMAGLDPIPLCPWRAGTLYPSVHDGLGPYTPLSMAGWDPIPRCP